MSNALREIAAVFGIEFDDKPLQDGVQSINGAVALVRQFGALLASSQVVGAVRDFAREFERAASAVDDGAATLGVTTDEFQEMGHALQLGGVEADQLGVVLQRLQLAMAASADGTGHAGEVFARLGVQTRDAHGAMRSVSDVMDDVAAGFDRVADPALRTATAQELFGRSGRRLLTILKSGEGGLAAFRREFHALGGGMSQEAIETATRYGDALDRWRAASTALRAQVAASLLPALSGVVTWWTRGTAQLARLVSGTHVMRLAMVGLGLATAVVAGNIVRMWLPALRAAAVAMRPWLMWAGVFAGIALAVDDLITLFEGGDSALGRWLDKTYGIGSSARFIRTMREAWEGLTLVLHDAGAWLDQLWRDFAEFGRWLDDTFAGPLGKIADMISRIARPVGSALSALGRGIASATGLDTVGQFWREAVTPVTAAAVPSVPVPAQGRGNVSTTLHAPITINGVTDPHAVARTVRTELDRRERQAAARRDGAYPIPPREG